MKIEYSPRAINDIDAAYRYLKDRSSTGAERVIAAIRTAAEFLAEQPFGSEATDHPSIRVKVVARYHYKIFYRVREDSVEIIHVRHTSRRPW